MLINASSLSYQALNEAIRKGGIECRIEGCLGQRFIAAGMDSRRISIDGIPGNALGAYLNGANIEVNGNAQDAVGDTMNAGTIVVHGNVGDAAGYAMRGGAIYIQGNAGYRAGVHMKAYGDRLPMIVIGGRAGSFLGEYQAGGVIVVLGLHAGEQPIVGNFPCTGMHGGKVFLRSDCRDVRFPDQVTARRGNWSPFTLCWSGFVSCSGRMWRNFWTCRSQWLLRTPARRTARCMLQIDQKKAGAP